MPWYKKALLFLLGILIFVLIGNIGVNYWIKKELPSILNEKNNSPYEITYKSLEIKLLGGHIIADSITVVPKEAIQNPKIKAGIYASIKSLKIDHVSIFKLLFSKKIKASKLTVTKPDIILYKDDDTAVKESKNITDKVVAPFRNTISVSAINLENCSLKIVSTKDQKMALIVDNLSINLEDVVIDDATVKEKIPFHYKSYTVQCDSLYFRANTFYHITAKNLKTTEKSFKMQDFKLIPEYDRVAFQRKIPKEKDLFTVNVKAIHLEKIDWGFEKDHFYFKSPKLTLDSLFANIYRNKEPADDLSTKPLYNKLLRELKFNLELDTLAINKSLVQYEEELSFKNGPGFLSFNNFNAEITNVYNGYQKNKLPDTKIKVDCRFMNTSALHVDWALNALDKSDGFTIRGSLKNFPSEKVSPFIKPHINVTTTGTLDQVYFNFKGNNWKSNGEFAIHYHDLKVVVYKKNGKEKNKFLSGIGNLFVKKDSDEKIKKATVEVERIQEKSFYNFLWRNLADGLVKTLI
ncbi:hypothetical protein [Flavobacterium sp. '19STA2R22 D10 B1']|uniref:hypothetical protein n=1 Tax=Flavobacterium aerium TaxID=3037261 RepID=UPI00278BD869|nr:hypothetical protein [Flavobacterium sp. '19STA2R22 D10 B1']